VLSFHEGEPTAAFEGAASWLAINADETTLGPKIDAAAAAGVSRVFVLISDAVATSDSLEAKLQASGMAYTVMRVGKLVDTPSGAGYKLGELDLPVCEDVAKEDVFRFVTEALTLDDAHGLAFSLCPSEGTTASLKEMRLCGYERRDEVRLLLQGAVPDADAVAAEAEAVSEAEVELVLRSEAEVAAEREEELKVLLEKARQRGIETQQRMAFEEAERLAKRKEQEKYYSAPPEPSDSKPTPSDTPETPPAA